MRPLQSLEAARDHLRRNAKPGERRGTVVLQAGVHRRRAPFRLEAEDSGSCDMPVTYRAAAGASVVLSGALPLQRSWFRPVTDRTTLAAIRTGAVRTSVLEIDLAAHGVADLGRLWRHGFAMPTPLPPVELHVGGARLQRARWPRQGWLLAGPAVHQARWRRLGFRAARRLAWQRLVRWVGARYWPTGLSDAFRCEPELLDAAGTPDGLMVQGPLTRAWAWSYNAVAAIDPTSGTVRLAFPERYPLPAAGGGCFAFDNTLAGLAEPGQYWLDVRRSRLLLVPPAGFDEPGLRIELAVLDRPMLELRGVRNVVLSGLVLQHGRDVAVLVDGGESVTLEACEIRGFGRGGVRLLGQRHRVRQCRLHDLGDTAITVAGGDRRTLEPAANTIEDCDIHDWGRWRPVYAPAVALDGVGQVVRHCILHDGPHMAVMVRGNDHLIEANEIHDVVRDFDDMGAIYVDQGKEPYCRGTRIRGNLIRDIGRGRSLVRGVYLDRSTMGLHVERNLLCRIGGRDAHAVGGNGFAHVRLHRNIFVDCASPFVLDCWLAEWGRKELALYRRIWRRAAVKGPPSAQYLHRYPELLAFAREDRVTPPGNRFDGNLVLNATVPLQLPCGHLTVNGPPDHIAAKGNSVIEATLVTVESDGRIVVTGEADVWLHAPGLMAVAQARYGPRPSALPADPCCWLEDRVE